MRKTIAGIVFLMTVTLLCGAAFAQTRVLATTFPVYQIVHNVVRDVPGMEVQLMLPAQAGCPHDYALTPQDVGKLAQADVLVVNGLGMEAFLGSPSARSKKELRTVDASKGISGLLPYTDEETAHEGHEGHHHGGMNPHLFASPRMAAQMARSIAGQLADLDPGNAAAYWSNGENYARTLDALADEFAALGGKLKNNRIITQHGVFDYLARDMGLEVAAVIQADDTQAPSASDMMKLVKAIRGRHVGAIFTEPQYPDKIAATLSRETGVATAKLDPVATGPAIAPLDYYEKTMRANLHTLESTLGTN
ncbi:metal ABC transporter solute-binding protein, Zn/Mn family [uncultured Bilophila sp.]|uniref:metal ABC transporter substrate-binding protein n=1 Tax=uncultured Bilophila sp. TaxID=529385 RepID=UPI00280AC3F1|nr:zinc ABC transporter substrate-binding protein [uncultured Bilophila sp.]